ncbi:ABC-2 type transport system ATP-binding protein [Methylobacillus rhizosphaerae]|uniref:ABC-2 type transport system ATP-binding protein n=1 Tax=Methylobacillus rhizosphaerae TaxID=551994 RepID=A0A238ZNB9_9PROT|nr:ABC transporter ATP-binding protein [Methylobacillus rhizosphaerae]SNR84163.1 ABC-2 type transport system ATP-binding protein [Methylobacillus rhizosphaerae]
MLKTIQLDKHFGSHQALKAISIDVKPGEIYCLLGANGAGKTTLINLFLNFLQPTGGQVLVNGRDVQQYPLESKRDIAYIPELVMLYGVLSGLENLEYFAALATGEKLPRDKLLSLLQGAGLDATAADRRVSTYSKGMRQKVGIAIAMAKNAKALLLDEPTSGLDPKAANEFSQLLTKAKDSGVAVLTTTHDLFHAKQTGTRIGIMRRGELLTELNSADVSHSELESLYLQYMEA